MENSIKESIKKDVRTIIEETDSAYYTYWHHDYMNADYANFAGMALEQFKNALRDPHLCREDLERILREGLKHYRSTPPLHRSAKQTDRAALWTAFMADYITQAKNANIQD